MALNCIYLSTTMTARLFPVSTKMSRGKSSDNYKNNQMGSLPLRKFCYLFFKNIHRQAVQTFGKNLAGLWRPSFVKVDKRLFAFGGGGNVINDLHVLDLITLRWDSVQASSGIPPSKRYGHTATRWNDSIVLFGGCNEFQDYCNDVHIFDLRTFTWSQPQITGVVSARYLHSAVVFNDKLFIYGGFAKSSDCTYVLDELNVLDLKSMRWSKYHEVPPRYNHSATLVGHKMYIYAGKDEHGNTVSDLFAVNLLSEPYTLHLVLSGSQSSINAKMILLKSQHFCDTACGKLLVFGRYLAKGLIAGSNAESTYSLWMLDLDTLKWKRQECDAQFDTGGWNYFTIISDETYSSVDGKDIEVRTNNLLFLGNTDPYRPQGYDHFRDALMIDGESLGLYDVPCGRRMSEFSHLLNNPEFSDFEIIPADGRPIYVHQVILISRWAHFRNMYQSGMLEVMERCMKLPESFDVVIAFLRYLYTDQLDENEPWTIICEVLVMANMYMLSRLKKMCCERLYRRHLTVDSCSIIFEKAIIAEETGLKLLVLDFMFRNYGSVLKSNMLLDAPPAIRKEFLEAVPEEAVLEVGRSRLLSSKFTSSVIGGNSAHGNSEPISSSVVQLASITSMGGDMTVEV